MLPADQLGVRECDPSVALPDDIPRRLAARPTEESWKRDRERVSPAVEDEARDVPFWSEPGSGEQFHHLSMNLPLELRIGCGEQLHASLRGLHPRRQARTVEGRVKGKDHWAVGIERRLVSAHLHRIADVARESEIALAPVPGRRGDAEAMEEAPIR